MSRFNPLLWSRPSVIWRYVIVILSVAAALTISQSPAFHLQTAPVSLFLCAVILSAWFGGAGPGLLATALSALAFYYYVLPPAHSFAAKPGEETPRLVIFMVSALFVGSLAAAQRRVTESLRRARDDLIGTVEQLQKTNEALQAASRERKRVEEELRRSEESLLEAQKLSHTGSWRHDVASGTVVVSPEIYRIHDIKPDEDASNTEFFFSRFHPEDRKRVVELFERAEIEKTEFQVGYRIVLPDGTIKYLHTIGHPISNESGDLVEFVGTAMDVTAAKQAEERILQSERQLRITLDTIPAFVWSHMPDGSVDFVNQRCLESTGTRREDVLGLRWASVVHPADRAKVLDERNAALAAGGPAEHEIRMRGPGGNYRWWLIRRVPLRDEHGRIMRWYVAAADIEDRKRAEEALRQARADLAHVNRVTTMGELTASLAHEVNQPIAAALTNANTCLRWLTRDQPDVEEARAAAMRIVNDGRRAAEIISRIRLLFKKGSPEQEPVDVNEITREMIVLLRGEATRYSISVQMELASDLPQVMGDRVQLQQVLMNLIMNGIDAMKDVDGTRELSVKSQRAKNEQLLITVSDTGVGLPPQQAEEIFNAFFTTKLNGTGMGLRISRSIVESHGGRLWAANNSPHGASFHVTLPTKAASDK
jgi:PAS domain S-box-containing protein